MRIFFLTIIYCFISVILFNNTCGGYYMQLVDALDEMAADRFPLDSQALAHSSVEGKI